MINIIGGKFKRRKIQVPLKKVRPTSSIKREAIFSILESYAAKKSIDIYKGRCFLDLYAGSGALGLEAISRGAKIVYFYENDQDVFKILKLNCKKICRNDQYVIHLEDSSFFKNIDINYLVSVIFLDPPYNLKNFDLILKKIFQSNILDKNGVIVIETSKENAIDLTNNFEVIKEKIYGLTKILFLRIKLR